MILKPMSEARNVFYDGPVAIAIHEASETEILAAYHRLGRLVAVSARLLGEEQCKSKSDHPAPRLPESCWSGNPQEKLK